MEQPNSSTELFAGAKRKRTPLADSLPTLGVVANGSNPPINYLIKAGPDRLGLIDGDAETFADVLAMIDDYEGKIVSFSLLHVCGENVRVVVASLLSAYHAPCISHKY